MVINMKHGYFVMGKDGGREFTFGKNETYHQACKAYWFAMSSNHISQEVKKTLRLVELVERELPKPPQK